MAENVDPPKIVRIFKTAKKMALLLHLFVVWRLIQREAAIINCFKGHVLLSRLTTQNKRKPKRQVFQ